MNIRQPLRGVTLVAILTIACVSNPVAFAGTQTAPASANDSSKGEETAGTKRALIVFGLSGDADHHKVFVETAGKFVEGLTRNLGFNRDDLILLMGDEPKETDPELLKGAIRSTRDELEKSVAQLRRVLKTNDSLWVIVVGHSHYDGRNSWLNLPGPDLHSLEFANLFNGIAAREQIFVMTTPTSELYIKPLSAKGRVVISATEDGWETSETEFPHEFARILTNPPATSEFDIDGDGHITVFDLYVTVSRNIAQSYLDQELLATEHSLLDDNGDGRGTEVQIDFLTVEQGGRPKKSKPASIGSNPNRDSGVARTIRLAFPHKEVEPKPATAEETPPKEAE
jgi:hypothetical protein